MDFYLFLKSCYDIWKVNIFSLYWISVIVKITVSASNVCMWFDNHATFLDSQIDFNICSVANIYSAFRRTKILLIWFAYAVNAIAADFAEIQTTAVSSRFCRNFAQSGRLQKRTAIPWNLLFAKLHQYSSAFNCCSIRNEAAR